MSDLRPLTPLGVRMRDSLPVVLRGSHDYLAVIHAYARELALLEGSIEAVRAQLNPLTANVLLSAWEAEVGLPVGGGGASDSARIAAIVPRLQRITGQAEGREWVAQIDAIAGTGWSYAEHNPNMGPLQNRAPNPGFEHDTLGASPAGWSFGTATHVAATNWSDTGVQSGRFTTGAVGPGAVSWIELLGPVTGPGSVGPGAWAVAGSDVIALRARVHTNSLGGGAFNYVWQVFSYDVAGVGLGSLGGLTVAAGPDADVQAIVTIPAAARYLQVQSQAVCVTAGSLDFNVDSVGVFIDPPGGVMPAFHTGDDGGWEWTGTVGNSASEPINPPDGTLLIVLPFTSGTPRWIEAVNAIRESSPAHLELAFVSSAAFALDLSDLDVSEFGA